MLSINIPVFNYDVAQLVNELIRQGNLLDAEYEIRVYDDCSDEKFRLKNRDIASENVVYAEMGHNIGRSSIRNKMGMDSKFRYLLFLDADSAIVNDNFLSVYLAHATKASVVCGGTVYSAFPPPEAEKKLRWVYGTAREAINAKIRNSEKSFHLTSNNFLIDKQVFEKIRFREEIREYGHEDTLLGFDLSQAGYSVTHIDNAVEHTGLENSEVFLEKTQKAVENLYYIQNRLLHNNPAFTRQVGFLNKYKKLTSYFPEWAIRTLFTATRKCIRKNLFGANPNLRLLDFYKTGVYALLAQKDI